ncbi:MAG: aldo/keto reductase [Planctomycetota bacterium]
MILEVVMRQRSFGSTGVTVGEIGFGGWAIGKHQWGEVDEQAARDAVKAALDVGVTFFDTAQEYGSGLSEEIFGEVLGGRDDVMLATKTGKYWDVDGNFVQDYSPQHITASVEGSLKRLNTDSIGLYQLHNPGVEVSRRPETWDALRQLQREGRISFYGSSIGKTAEAQAAIDNGAAALQFEVHMAEPRHRELLDMAAEAGVAVIARTPLAWGALSGKYFQGVDLPESDFRAEGNWGHKAFTKWVERARDLAFLQREGQTLTQAALRYVLAQPAVAVVIPGGKTAEQVRENCAAAEGKLTDDELARIAEVQKSWESQ